MPLQGRHRRTSRHRDGISESQRYHRHPSLQEDRATLVHKLDTSVVLLSRRQPATARVNYTIDICRSLPLVTRARRPAAAQATVGSSTG